jgi:iron complex outermembrane recepter protein
MRRTSTILWSTSALAFALCATPAFAQDTTQATPPDPAATAQETPADPAQNADAPVDPQAAAGAPEDNTIVVTGLRRSLQSSQNIKRNSDQIVDSIVAADIGKLPDIAVSDTAARIPGIQVTRERGEADRVLLRGLDRTYYTTTYNSREIFTAETRSVALQDFPSGAISALEAFKTSTANLIEPGIAGLINVRSRRPFDFKGLEINGSFWAMHPRQSKDWTPNGNIMITDRWDVGDGEMGALLNFSYTKLHYLDSIMANAYFVAPGPEGGRFPDWPFIEYNEATRTRPSLNGAIQWRPNPDLEFYVEGLWQGFRHDIQDRHFEVPLWGGASYTNLVMRPTDAGNLIESGTVTNPFRGEGWQGGTYNKTNTYQFAGGFRYDAGSLLVTGDLARTDSTFTGSTESVDYLLPENCQPDLPCRGTYTVDFIIGAPGDIPTFRLNGLDPTNPANFAFRGLFEERQQAKGDDWQARLDFEYELGMPALPRLQWGVRWVNRDARRVYGSCYSRENNPAIRCRAAGFPDVFGTPLSAVPLDYELFDPGFRGADNPPFPTTWLAPTYSSIRDNLEELRAFVGMPAGGPEYDPTASFNASEKSLAGYAQLNYEFPLGGDMSIDGQLGVRAVHVSRDLSGTQRAETAPGVFGFIPIDESSKDTYFLPNLNARIRFTPDLQLRLAATKTRTRPQFNDLNPSLRIGQAPVGCNPAVTNCETPASGGNPNLTDLKSTNFDASLEYYFSRTGFASIAAFKHNLEGFVTPSSFISGEVGGFPLRVSAPINSGKGHVRGFEAQVNTFFDFVGGPEWLSWFGLQANLTHVDAEAKYPRPVLRSDPAGNPILGRAGLTNDPSDPITRPLLNVSKWSYNLIGMFERGPASVRLAYNKRSPYWGDTLGRSGWLEDADFSSGDLPYVLRHKIRDPGRLDLSASYTFLDRFTVFADWTNILSKPLKAELVRMDPTGARFDPDTSEKVRFAWYGRYNERILSLGVRFRFDGGSDAAAAPAPAALPPPPPPPIEAAPLPAPPPPPPPPPAPERG